MWQVKSLPARGGNNSLLLLKVQAFTGFSFCFAASEITLEHLAPSFPHSSLISLFCSAFPLWVFLAFHTGPCGVRGWRRALPGHCPRCHSRCRVAALRMNCLSPLKASARSSSEPEPGRHSKPFPEQPFPLRSGSTGAASPGEAAAFISGWHLQQH